MNEVIEVGNTIWNTETDRMIGQGSDAKVYSSTFYPHYVLIIFRESYQYKYDWYDYIDIILGQSMVEDKHVLILPKLEKVSPSPDWYSNIRLLVHKVSTLVGYEELEKHLVQNNPDGEEREWIDKMLNFLDSHRRYLGNNHIFDLSTNNIMLDGSTYIITDPFIRL